MNRLWLAAALLWTAVASADERRVSVGSCATETLFALGEGESIVAVDRTSIYPSEAQALPKVGGHRQVNVETVLSLGATQVFLAEGVGPQGAVDQLRSAGVEVIELPEATDLESAKNRILTIAKATNADASKLLAEWPADTTENQGPKVAFLYARGGGTLMLAGQGTGIDAVVRAAGGQLVGDWDGFRPVSAEALVAMAPDVLLMTSRGLESLGGTSGLSQVPGLAMTPAGANHQTIAMDDVLLLSLGPRTPQAVVELRAALAEAAK